MRCQPENHRKKSHDEREDREVILADGKTVRYRARGVSVGKDPVTGKRMQRTISGARKKDVEAEVTRISAAVDKGSYTRPWDGTVAAVLDSYLREAAKGKEANTRAAYRHALRLPRERLGHRRAMSITRDDIRDLVSFAAAQGRVAAASRAPGCPWRQSA